MDVTTILLLLLIGSIATFFAGDKLASKVASKIYSALC